MWHCVNLVLTVNVAFCFLDDFRQNLCVYSYLVALGFM